MTDPSIRRKRTDPVQAERLLRCRRLIHTVLLLTVTLLPAAPAMAGSGRVNNTGTIDITVNLRFPPTPADLTQVQNQITAASQVLWDASEGQLRFGNVTITCGAVNEDLADMWVFPQDGRAGVSYATDGSLLGDRGVHVTQFLPSSTGVVMAHEFGHLALGLGDEYDEQNRFGACWGFGQCIETANLTEQNHCLMQQPAGFTQTEFCTTGMHDTVVGEGTPCTAGAAPCTDNCQFFSPATGRYETTQQTDNVNRSCWTHLVATFTFLTAPAGLPAAAAPGGFVNPVFTNNCTSTNTVLLVLDKSGSMGWHPDRDNGEVCANTLDDDGDGSVDETSDCAQPRLSFLQAAARGFLTLANNKGVRAGIISFNQTPTLEAGFQDVTNMTLGTLQGRVDGLGAGGNTAIGRALSSSTLLFGAETGANKTAFLISDGVNTEGEDPRTVVPALRAQGIRVLTISTGDASNDSTLSEISGTTAGARVDSRSATALVGAFVQQWARYINEGTLIPLLPYATDAQGSFEQEPSQARGASDWIKAPVIAPTTNVSDVSDTTFAGIGSRRLPSNNYFEVLAEKGMSNLTLVLAGNLSDMNGFGVEAVLDGPAGPNPTHFDSLSPHPLLRVTRDRFFVLLELADPNPGRWLVQVRSRSGSAPVQTGNLTVIGTNPLTDLFTSLDKHVVSGPADAVRLGVSPIYFTPLRNVSLEAVLVRPDGTTAPITLTTNFGTGGGEDYAATISGLTLRGLYEVRVRMRTAPGSQNDPGESIYAPAPSNSLPVPPLERTAVEYIFVTSGTIPCPTGRIGDCDGDGVQGESPTADADNDTIPDDLDHDSDNDEVPDARETDNGRPIDSDHDNRPDHQDPDSDNDTIPDGQDSTPRGDDGSSFRLLGSFHVGSAHPLGSLDREADANIYVNIDLAYRIRPRLNLKAMLGLAQLTEEIGSAQPHPRFLHFSANAQALFPTPSGLALYLQAGPGWYRSKGGTTDPGFNVGFGGQIPIHSPFKLELGADLHQVQADRPARFWTLQLGVLFR